MKLLLSLVPVVLALSVVEAGLNEPCLGAGNAPGVCISTSDCTSKGGTHVTGACPRTPADVRCCTKASCGGSAAEVLVDQASYAEYGVEFAGNCRWTSDCTTNSVSNLCPGPTHFKCCQSPAGGFGGYGNPIEHYGSCKQVAINGAKRVIAQFPGRVREVFCIRDCPCSDNPESDHCCGKATDLMCSDHGGGATMSGQGIAEWVMRNHVALKVKYIIWGQRIWNPTRNPPDQIGSWQTWRDMEHRGNNGDMTQNHWDHVHVSYQ